MGRSKDEFTQYIKDLATEKGFTPEQTEAALNLLTGDTDTAKVIGSLVDLAVGRQSDYSRAMNETKTEKDKAQKLFHDNVQWRNDVQAQMTNMKTQLDAQSSIRAKYEEKYGPLDETEDLGGGQSRTATGAIVDTEALNRIKQEAKAEAQTEFAKIMLERDALMARHSRTFKGEILDTNELVAHMAKAQSEGRTISSLNEAYDELYGPKVQQIAQQAEKKKLDDAREEGARKAREEMSKLGLKSGAAVPESGAFWDHMSAQEKSQQQQSDKSAGSAPALSDIDRENAFTADLRSELSKREEQFQRETA